MVQFIAPAVLDYGVEPKDVMIESIGGEVFVDRQKAEMTCNGIQLRFEIKGFGNYIVFNHVPNSCPPHPPTPKPILEMYHDLGGV